MYYIFPAHYGKIIKDMDLEPNDAHEFPVLVLTACIT
jgi:hypothetical protein